MLLRATSSPLSLNYSHMRKIYEKLHVGSSTEAVSKALKDRLV